MKLNFVLLFCALFAYSECMNLSDSSKILIRSILNTHGGITDPDNFMTDVNGLTGTFTHLDEEGSSEMAKALVEAYKNSEFDLIDIQKMMMEAVRLGKFGAYFHFSRNFVHYSSDDVIRVAATNGHVNILDSEYKINPKKLSYFKGSFWKILVTVVPNGYDNVISWFAEKGLMECFDAGNVLYFALESNNQDLFKYLLHEPIYSDNYRPGKRFTFKDCLIKREFVQLDMILFKAAAVGNMYVVQYLLGQDDLFTIIELIDLIEALQTPVENNHTEIAKLIADFTIKHIQECGKNGTLEINDAKYILKSALEPKNESIIDLILYGEIYRDPLNSDNRLNYEQVFINDQNFENKDVLIKAAKVGNTEVVEYFLSRGFPINRKILEEVRSIATTNNLTEILGSIGIFLMFN